MGSRFEILVSNRQKGTRLSETKLKQTTRKILKLLGWRRVSLSLVLVDDAGMRRLNLRYLGKNRPTDVLTFGQEGAEFFPKSKTSFLGDVVVSIATARRTAPRFGKRWDEELLLYICHGVLHLMGYRDATTRQKAKMDRKQQEILRKVLGPKWPFRKQKPLF